VKPILCTSSFVIQEAGNKEIIIFGLVILILLAIVIYLAFKNRRLKRVIVELENTTKSPSTSTTGIISDTDGKNILFIKSSFNNEGPSNK
jgi:hypothetical protein